MIFEQHDNTLPEYCKCREKCVRNLEAASGRFKTCAIVPEIPATHVCDHVRKQTKASLDKSIR